MGIKETNVFKRCIIDLSPLGCRIARNNRGLFLTLDGKRKVFAGLDFPGSGDGIGFALVEVTEAMVGKKIPVFLSLETKQGDGRLSQEQKEFIGIIEGYGGIALSAHSSDEAVAKVNARLLEIRWQ